MKRFKQLLAVAITLTILVSSLPFVANAEQTSDFSDLGMGDLSLETENTDDVAVISSVDDYYAITKTGNAYNVETWQ